MIKRLWFSAKFVEFRWSGAYVCLDIYGSNVEASVSSVT
jgi:hypothetical protein